MIRIEALESATELWKKGLKSPFSASEKQEIKSLYGFVMHKSVRDCNCKDKYSDVLIEIINYLKNNDMNPECDYQLKSGVVIQIFGKSDVYTNDNLTNEVAAAYLAEFPGKECLFEKIAVNKKERTKEESDTSATEELVRILVGELSSGKTKTALKVEYKGYQIAGKTITARVLQNCINKALSVNE